MKNWAYQKLIKNYENLRKSFENCQNLQALDFLSVTSIIVTVTKSVGFDTKKVKASCKM